MLCRSANLACRARKADSKVESKVDEERGEKKLKCLAGCEGWCAMARRRSRAVNASSQIPFVYDQFASPDNGPTRRHKRALSADCHEPSSNYAVAESACCSE